jgi:murein L,D-transpeptidase YcbB/YkuD
MVKKQQKSTNIFLFFGILVVLALSGTPVQAQRNPLAIVADALSPENSILTQASITQALEIGHVDGQKFYDAPGMKAFYEARDYSSVWLASSFMRQRKAETLLKSFEASWKHGLNPATYRIEEIKSLMETAKGTERFALDLVLSDALVRYGRDLTGMRVAPKSIGQRSKYWRTPLRGIDILDHVANASDTRGALASLAPQGALYKKLQEELVQLYKTEDKVGKAQFISIQGIIRPGSSNKAILLIRERMGFVADSAPQGAYYYDDKLAQAVMAFQKGQGVRPDGIVGPQTVKLMNITNEDRINQILVNLERLRWGEPNKPERYVMVNVPSATLWAVEKGKVKFEMPVVVGRKKRPTNIFSAKITGIRFNPTWTVPPTIKRDDYLPKLREDPYYLTDRGIELIDKDNMTVDPGLINWEEKTWHEVNLMRMVQGSGRANPLGLVRVIMENPFNIYLHDTPTKSYFKRSYRALSSGCVRMSDPQKLADFVLAPNDNWSEERKKSILAKGKEKNIWAHKPLPVYILYQTVWLGAQGQIVYGQDLYGHDYKLLKELKKIDGVAIPTKGAAHQVAQNNVSS